MAGTWFSFWFSGCWWAGGRLPQARRGRVLILCQFTITTVEGIGGQARARVLRRRWRGWPRLTAAVLRWGFRGEEGARRVELEVRWGAGSEGDGVSSGDSRDARRGRFLLGGC